MNTLEQLDRPTPREETPTMAEKTAAELLDEFDAETAKLRRKLAAELEDLEDDDDEDDGTAAFAGDCRCHETPDGLVCVSSDEFVIYPVEFAASPQAGRMTPERLKARLKNTATGRAILRREAAAAPPAPPALSARVVRWLEATPKGRARLQKLEEREVTAPAPAPPSGRARERLQNTSTGRTILRRAAEAAAAKAGRDS
jgi:hypothetical protein